MDQKASDLIAIDEYIAQFPEDVQQILNRIRSVIKEAAPEATEKMSYDMPAFYLDGFLVSYAVWKKHIGFYPRTAEMDALIDGLSAYQGTKGSVHFPLDKPMPYELIGQMAKIRAEENEQL
jgi:uncharacterized protein YdhG (YjbR/CyaY superfamily)